MNEDKCREAFEEIFEVPDFLHFDGEDYMYYEDDPILKEAAQDIQSKWSGFQAALSQQDKLVEALKIAYKHIVAAVDEVEGCPFDNCIKHDDGTVSCRFEDCIHYKASEEILKALTAAGASVEGE